MSMDSIRKKTISGLFWAFAEKIGAQAISFLVSIVLARLLLPEEYGVSSIVLVIISLCNVFVDSGLARALIQSKDTTEVDYSSVFYCTLVLSLVVYGTLYFAAPYIAAFYNMEILSPVARVMGLRLLLAPYSSVVRAKVSKQMEFKKFFFSSLGGTLISGVAGVCVAYMGFGVWALVAQDLVDAFVDTVVLGFAMKWWPKCVFSFRRVKALFGYGWKILAGGLIDTLYDNFRSLYIGKLYSAEDLAFYTRGNQFPNLLVENIDASICKVLFPAISSRYGNRAAMKTMTRRAMKTSSYVLTPVLLGLAAVAEPMVELILTETWLPCVPYLQVLCINYALTPLQTANIQAIYASGRSDICLKLNVVKKTVGLLLILTCARISVMAMVWAGVACSVFSLILDTLPNRKLLDYRLREQLRDVVPCWLLSGGMVLCVRLVSMLDMAVLPKLALMVFTGVVSYILLSLVFRVESFFYLWNLIRRSGRNQDKA